MAFDLQSSQLSINTRLLQYQIQKKVHIPILHAKSSFTTKKKESKQIFQTSLKKLKFIQISNYRGKTITAGFFTKEDEEVNGLRKKSPFFGLLRSFVRRQKVTNLENVYGLVSNLVSTFNRSLARAFRSALEKKANLQNSKLLFQSFERLTLHN